MRLLDAGSGTEKANCPSVSLTSVYIGKVIRSEHSSQRNVTVRLFGENWKSFWLLRRMRKAARCSFGERYPH